MSAQTGGQSDFEPASMPVREGDNIDGKYEVMGLLGSGEMTVVVAGRRVDLGERIALKFLRPECLSHAELVARFVREARASIKIESEQVAQVFDVAALPDGAPFVVMEYLDGKDLGELIREKGPAPLAWKAEYRMQAC